MNIHNRILRCKAQHIERKKEHPMAIHLGDNEIEDLRAWLETTPRSVDPLLGSVMDGLMVLPSGNSDGMKCT